MALKLLEGDAWTTALVDRETRSLVAEQDRLIKELTGEDADLVIAESRYSFIHALTHEVLKQKFTLQGSITESLDRIVLNRLLGLPIFFGVMYLMFFFTIHLGRAFKPFFNLCIFRPNVTDHFVST
ncbi:MAG: hypothetical protein Kow0060_24590 [Methylohalobius crimeensis]